MCSILDDIEMYEQQEPFQLSDYTGLSYFLNNFLYKTIQDNVFGMCARKVYLFIYFANS